MGRHHGIVCRKCPGLQSENKRLKELWESIGKQIAYLKTMDEVVEVAYELEEIQKQALKEKEDKDE